MTYPIITPELEKLTLERDILALKVEIAQLTDFIEARKVATSGPCDKPDQQKEPEEPVLKMFPDGFYRVEPDDEKKDPPVVPNQPQAVYIDIQGIRNEDVELYLNIAKEAISRGYIIPRATDDELNSHKRDLNKVHAEFREMEDMLQVCRYAYLRARFSRRDTRNPVNNGGKVIPS